MERTNVDRRTGGFYQWGQRDLHAKLAASLVFPQQRWAKLAGRPGTKGLLSVDVGVADEAECLRDLPRVPFSSLMP